MPLVVATTSYEHSLMVAALLARGSRVLCGTAGLGYIYDSYTLDMDFAPHLFRVRVGKVGLDTSTTRD